MIYRNLLLAGRRAAVAVAGLGRRHGHRQQRRPALLRGGGFRPCMPSRVRDVRRCDEALLRDNLIAL